MALGVYTAVVAAEQAAAVAGADLKTRDIYKDTILELFQVIMAHIIPHSFMDTTLVVISYEINQTRQRLV